MRRRKDKIDENQLEIVAALRCIPGVKVQPGHDDILVGFRGRTFWYEIKNPDEISKKTGKILYSAIKPSQYSLQMNWTGQYKIVSTFDEIIKDMGIKA